MVGYGSYETMMNTLEKAVSSQPFVSGDRFTAADVYVGSHIGWGLRFGSIEDRPAFRTYMEKMAARPAWQRANALDDEAMKALQKG